MRAAAYVSAEEHNVCKSVREKLPIYICCAQDLVAMKSTVAPSLPPLTKLTLNDLSSDSVSRESGWRETNRTQDTTPSCPRRVVSTRQVYRNRTENTNTDHALCASGNLCIPSFLIREGLLHWTKSRGAKLSCSLLGHQGGQLLCPGCPTSTQRTEILVVLIRECLLI